MRKRCDDPNRGPASPDRRAMLIGGLAALPSLTQARASMVSGQQPTAGNGPYPARAYVARNKTDGASPMQIERRSLGPNDVLVDILYCAICHSDIHHIYDDWGTQIYPTVPGHEIIGRISAVGNAVTKFQVGDIGGIGTLVDACRVCVNCVADHEHICVNGPTITFDSPDHVSGGRTLGGFSDKIVVKEHFVVRIPPGMDLPSAAPLLCAGITTYSPMQHWKLERGQRVGVVGIGGLGHIAVKLAAARGADVTMFTTTPGKIADAQRLGARNAVLWADEAAMRPLAAQFDLIIVTIPQPFPIGPFLRVLKYDGPLINLGVLTDLVNVDGRALAAGRKSVAGSLIGGIAETQQVVDYCFSHGIKPDVELIDVRNINQAFARVRAKDIRYRFVIDMSSLKAT